MGGAPGFAGGWAPGSPAGFGYPRAAEPAVRHRPGKGAVVAAAGLLLLLGSLFGLPWFSANGEDVTFPDIQDMRLGGSTTGDIIEWYGDWGWIVVLGTVGLGILVATLLVPGTLPARVVLGVVTGGAIGALLMALDKDGTVAPRIWGALSTVAAMAIHGFVVVKLFDGSDLSPGIGIWASAAGLLAILAGCVMGTADEDAPAAPYAYR